MIFRGEGDSAIVQPATPSRYALSIPPFNAGSVIPSS